MRLSVRLSSSWRTRRGLLLMVVATAVVLAVAAVLLSRSQRHEMFGTELYDKAAAKGRVKPLGDCALREAGYSHTDPETGVCCRYNDATRCDTEWVRDPATGQFRLRVKPGARVWTQTPKPSLPPAAADGEDGGGDDSNDGDKDGDGGEGVVAFGGWDVPKASQNDKNWCKTWMSDPNDDGSCFALMYHHCVDGLTDQARIPAAIRTVKQSALKQVYDVQRTCKESKNGKTYKCFTKPPDDWTSLCVARPDLAGKGKCKLVTPDEWRVWVKGEDPFRQEECQFSSLYIKSHFRGAKIQDRYTGKHGRG